MSSQPQVAVIMGSSSDGDIADLAIDVLNEFGISHEVGIKSAHRTPREMIEYSEGLADSGVQAVIAIAGGSAHLPGMVASSTCVPVLAVPVKRMHHNDEALKSSIAMPSGIPLAVFPNNGADRAALFAVRMLALNNSDLMATYLEHQNLMRQTVADQDSQIQKNGWDEFGS